MREFLQTRTFSSHVLIIITKIGRNSEDLSGLEVYSRKVS